MLSALSRLLEERDETLGHGARVATLAEAVAGRLGWEADRIAALRHGAYLHDIGKLAVSRAVLRKSGPLTEAELAEIRAHPRAGASFVLALRGAWLALPYVVYHHERWDGTGYPSRLSGESIPLGARLVAVADTFDAMTSPRPYTDRVGTEHAFTEIARCAGTQFDPAMVDVFLDVWARPARSMPRRRAWSGLARSLRR
jgi:putative nucleotidyltransferase with HDIG domain